MMLSTLLFILIKLRDGRKGGGRVGFCSMLRIKGRESKLGAMPSFQVFVWLVG